MQRHFHEELEDFHTNLLKMASMVEENLQKAFLALKDQDRSLAEEVIKADKRIDELEISNDENAIDLIALNQPMAVDLRMITTGIHINSELEMMADLVVNIAQRAIELGHQPALMPLTDIEKLVQVAKGMVRGVSDAFIQKDIALAKEVIRSDGESNRLRDVITSELINNYMIKDGTVTPRAVALLLVARDLERICDFAAAMAEDIIYMIEAKIVKHHPERLANGSSREE